MPLPSGNRKTTRERVGGKIIRKSKAASTIAALHQLEILFCKQSPHRIIEKDNDNIALSSEKNHDPVFWAQEGSKGSVRTGAGPHRPSPLVE